MDEATRIALENYRRLNDNQRRGFNVRINGEEHRATSRQGVANIHFPMDGQLMNVSELAMKIIINDGANQQTDEGCSNWNWGYNTYIHFDDWLNRYPVGSKVNTDCAYDCQCWDYADAFWRAQVNRRLETGNKMAWGTWALMRDYNAGTEFELIYEWRNVKRGDWVVWGNNGTGHIAMAMEDSSSSAITLLFRQQDGLTPQRGVFDSRLPFEGLAHDNSFQGAFRYKGYGFWNPA